MYVVRFFILVSERSYGKIVVWGYVGWMDIFFFFWFLGKVCDGIGGWCFEGFVEGSYGFRGKIG